VVAGDSEAESCQATVGKLTTGAFQSTKRGFVATALPLSDVRLVTNWTGMSVRCGVCV